MDVTSGQRGELRALVNSSEVAASVATRARIVLWWAEGRARPPSCAPTTPPRRRKRPSWPSGRRCSRRPTPTGPPGTPRPRSPGTTPNGPAPNSAPAGSTSTTPTTASPPPEWFDLHTATEAAEDDDREIREEHELHNHANLDDLDDLDQATTPETAGHGDVVEGVAEDVVVETVVPDIRDTSTLTPTEKTDPAHRDRVPDVDETDASVKRAQAALVEVAARVAADAQRAAHGEAARQEELARWSTDDTTTRQDTEPVYER